jgi:hypothetical protein
MHVIPTAGPHIRYVIYDSDKKKYWDGKTWSEKGSLYYSHEDAAKILRNIQLVEGLGKSSKRYQATLTLDLIGDDIDKEELVKYLVKEARLTLNSPSNSTLAVQIDWGTLEEVKDEARSSASTGN